MEEKKSRAYKIASAFVWLLLIADLIGLLFIIVFNVSEALADEPQVVWIDVVPLATPRPVYQMDDDIPTYKHSKKDVDRIARLLWSSPLRSESEKTKLVWVVLNRVDAGEPFGTTIHDVVNASEFTFFDRKARVSDKNKALVENVMNLWKAQKDGYKIGCRPPQDALYCRFGGEGNRKLALLTEPSGKEIAW